MAETGYVYYRGGMTTAERKALLDAYENRLTAVIHYTPNQIAFEEWPPAALKPTGQAFGENVEIRWQADEKGWRMLLLSETPQSGLTGWEKTEMVAKTDDASLILWGDHWHSLAGAADSDQLPDGWVQAQIEADLHYPVAGGGADRSIVRAKTKTYYQRGMARLTRFTAVTATRPVMNR
ncbi:MAG: hypothetical protein GY803_09945 [Chloroflexi bacterium]|nr:hypothetical protein [Chloroflexota bacterium]